MVPRRGTAGVAAGDGPGAGCPRAPRELAFDGGHDLRRSAWVASPEAGHARVAQLPQGARLDLADALTGEIELLADLGQRVRLGVVEAEAQRQHAPLPLGQA